MNHIGNWKLQEYIYRQKSGEEDKHSQTTSAKLSQLRFVELYLLSLSKHHLLYQTRHDVHAGVMNACVFSTRRILLYTIELYSRKYIIIYQNILYYILELYYTILEL